MRLMAGAAILALFSAWAADATAQDRFGDFGRYRIRWYSDLDRAIGMKGGGEDPNDPFGRNRFFRRMERGEKKFILVYIRPVNESKIADMVQNA